MMQRAILGLLLFTLVSGCSHRALQPLSYDPPGSTVTTDKAIEFQPRRTISFSNTGVAVSNEFEGARLNDFWQVNDSVYTALILPENHPVNNSAWYAFKIWARSPQRVTVNLTYRHGTHRYYPKLSRDGRSWAPLDSSFFSRDTANGTATLKLDIGPDTLWVSAQELMTSRRFAEFVDELARLPFVHKRIVGHSRMGRPLFFLEIRESDAFQGQVFIISRQHPPEVTGTLALMTFVRTLCEDAPLARRFRQKFRVAVMPLVNPDGVDMGHWRHNAAGVDLNRDWFQFNQPETRIVRDTFTELAQDRPVYFALDFHSTQEDVFYTLAKDLKTNLPEITDRWLAKLHELLPDYPINESPSGLGSPVSKNWFYQTFNAAAVTYEVGDEDPRDHIHRVAQAAARALMQVLLEAI